jgi:hypothetical protein
MLTCPESDQPAEILVDVMVARQYSKVRNYVEVNRMAVKEMHRQVGDLIRAGWRGAAFSSVT